MKVLSLFGGISTGQEALKQLNILVSRFVEYEIDDMPKKVTLDNFPNTELHSDVRTCNPLDYEGFDLLLGGSPCNDLSSAMANRDGLAGAKSSLFFEYVRILKGVNPKYFLFENVGSMKKEDERIINQLLGCEPIKINSKDFSYSLRNRYYWTNIPTDDEDLFKNDVQLNDILEDGYWSDRKKARALLASDSRPLTSPIKMVHRYVNTGFTTIVFKNKEVGEAILLDFKTKYKGMTAKQLDTFIEHKPFDAELYSKDNIRYLNQNELEACQGMPKGYTKVLSRNQAAHCLGNCWTLPVVKNLISGVTYN